MQFNIIGVPNKHHKIYKKFITKNRALNKRFKLKIFLNLNFS